MAHGVPGLSAPPNTRFPVVSCADDCNPLKYNRKSTIVDRKSLKNLPFIHANLFLWHGRQITEMQRDRTVFPAQKPGVLSGSLPFICNPTKLELYATRQNSSFFSTSLETGSSLSMWRGVRALVPRSEEPVAGVRRACAGEEGALNYGFASGGAQNAHDVQATHICGCGNRNGHVDRRGMGIRAVCVAR
jgi:hypothetical protein